MNIIKGSLARVTKLGSAGGGQQISHSRVFDPVFEFQRARGGTPTTVRRRGGSPPLSLGVEDRSRNPLQLRGLRELGCAALTSSFKVETNYTARPSRLKENRIFFQKGSKSLQSKALRLPSQTRFGGSSPLFRRQRASYQPEVVVSGP